MITSPRVRSHRGRQRGQSLVIFALVAMVLFGVVGMAVDGGFGFFVSDRLERGAMAAALAGVPNMPDYNSAPNDATSSAIAAAKLNGWTAGGPTNVTISVNKVPTSGSTPQNPQYYRNRLSVTVAADVPTFFMKVLGFGTHREARTAVAEYLRPITFGQPGSQLGSDLANLGNAGTSNYYFMRTEGWGTDRGQGDAYGPSPADWRGGNASSATTPDTHALSAYFQTEASVQPFALPTRGGASYQVYVPPNETTTIKVYNPGFAPDNGVSHMVNGINYTYHEDDGDFPETGTGCTRGSGPGAQPCAGPTNVQQWPLMSYTVYKSSNPFDHTTDTWLSNLTVQSIDATSTTTYTVPGVTSTAQPIGQLSLMYHNWMDITSVPVGPQYKQLATATYAGGGNTAPQLTGGANGTTYRLRVDQLDSDPANFKGDPAANGRVQTQNSQAHKGYAVQAAGCPVGGPSACTVTALDDITVFTPVSAGGFNIPLVSIPPEYQGRSFSLYIFDPGDVGCSPGNCSNVITVMRPTNNGASLTAASTSDGVFATGSSQQGGSYSPVAALGVPPGQAAVQTQNSAANPKNIYNGRWVRIDVAVPGTYATDVNPNDASTWFWNLNYSTGQTASDTITANLGFAGAPVHLISG